MANLASSAEPRVRPTFRRAEVDYVLGATSAAEGGFGCGILWLGEPGIGRTALLDTATSAVQQHRPDFRHLAVTSPASASGADGLGAFRTMAHQLMPRNGAATPQGIRPLLELQMTVEAVPGVVDAMVHLLHEASAAFPLLITIDDLPLGHGFASTMASRLAVHLSGLPVLLLVTAEQGPELSDAQAGDLAPITVRTIGGLEPMDFLSMLHQLVETRVPPSVANALCQHLGGNPGALNEVVRLLERDQLAGWSALPDPLPAQATIRRLYEPLLTPLTTEQRYGLLVAALTLDGSVDAVEMALDRPVTAVLDCLPHRLWNVFSERYTLSDPRLRAAVLARVSHREQRAAHHALAEAYADLDPALATWHAARASASTSPEVGTSLTAAASGAMPAGRPAVAATLATEALRQLPVGSARHDALLLAARISFADGFLSDAARLLDELTAADTTDELRGTALYLRVAALSMRDGAVPHPVVEGLLPSLRASRPEDAAHLLLLLSQFAAEQYELPAAREYLEQAEALLPAEPSATLVYDHALTRSWLSAMSGHAASAAAALPPTALEQLGLPGMLCGLPHARRAIILNRAGRGAEARTLVNWMMADRTSRESALYGATAAAAGLGVALNAGMVQQAREIVDASSLRLPLQVPFGGLSMTDVAKTLTLQGETETARSWAIEARRLAQQTNSGPLLITVPAQLAMIAMMRGDVESASNLYGVAAERLRIVPNPFSFDVYGPYAEALSVTNRGDVLVRLMARVNQSLGDVELTAQSAAVLARLELSAASRDLIVSTGLSALDACTSEVSLLERAHTEYLFGQRLLTLTQAEHAAQVAGSGAAVATNVREHAWLHLQRARGHFIECGATGLAGQAAAAVNALAVPSAPAVEESTSPWWAPLTEQEHRIATMVAGGATNKEVAGKLYLSVRTVEVHLTRTYRKLGLRSRAELTELVARNAEAVPPPVGG